MATGNDNHGRSRTQFALGQVRMTRGAAAFATTGERPFPFLAQHQQGDWLAVSAEDAPENAFSVMCGFRILSAYTLRDGTRIWILIEPNRSATTILLPEEY